MATSMPGGGAAHGAAERASMGTLFDGDGALRYVGHASGRVLSFGVERFGVFATTGLYNIVVNILIYI